MKPAPTIEFENGSRITVTASAAAESARGLRSPAPILGHVVYQKSHGLRPAPGWHVLTIYDRVFFHLTEDGRRQFVAEKTGGDAKNWHLVEGAFAVRQPWAWAILTAGKRLENRKRRFCPPGWYYLSASAAMTEAEYMGAEIFMTPKGILVPDPSELTKGALVGIVRLGEWVEFSTDPWFMGPVAATIEAAVALPAIVPTKAGQGVFYPFRKLQAAA